MPFDKDIAIVVGFLIANLVFGLFSGRGIKNIKEYALGNRSFSTATIAATIAATWLGAHSLTITVSETYSRGLYFVIPGLGDAISFFIVSYFYAPRMKEFLGKLSIAEAMNSIYGRHVRMVTAVSGIFPAIGNVAVQFSILTALLNHWLGIPGIYATIISSLVVIIYSTFGGIKSVTFTDLIQFFTFGIIIPMIAFLIWNSLTDSATVFNTLIENPLFNYRSVFDYHDPNFLNILFLFLFFMIPGVDPAIFQRISMSRNTLQISKSFIIAGFFVIICDLTINTFIGILLKLDNAPELTSIQVVGYIIDHYLNSGFKGIFIIGIMAMIMSTADSYINSSAILFAYDFCKSTNIKLTDQKELLLVRIASLLIGISALLLSLVAQNLLDLILSAYSFYMPIVSVPFILAIFGFRSTSKAVLIGMGAGFITVICFKLFSELDSVMPGMIANIVFLMGSHYILRQQGGWVGIKDKAPLNALRLERKRKINKFIQSVKTFSLIKFCQNNTPKEEKIYVYFGLFCIVSIFSNAYSLPKNLQEQHADILNPIYYSVLTLSTIFITYPFWLEKFKNKPFIFVLWNIAVFYNLAVSSNLLIIIGKFNQIQIAILMANLITVAILMRWKIAMLVIIGGAVISIKGYETYIGPDFLPDNMNSLQFKIMYSLFLVISILIAFLKPKEEQQELAEQQNLHLEDRMHLQEEELEKSQELKYEFLRNLQHEVNTPIMGITNLAQTLFEKYDKLNNKQLKQSLEIIAKSSERFDSLTRNLLDLSRLSSLTYELHKTNFNLSEVVYDRLNHCRKLYLGSKDLEFLTEITPDIKLKCDEHYITSTIDNLIINAIQYSSEGKITIKLTNTDSEIEFSINDEGLGIPKEELYDIFGAFIVSSKTHTPAGGRGIGLALCKKVIEVHGGKISAESDGEKGTSFKFTLPLISNGSDTR